MFSFGDDPASFGEYGWYEDNSDKKVHPVGEKKPNAWGLYDMHGNVWEWCSDWFYGGYYANSPMDDPMGPNSPPEPPGTAYRVYRGGGRSGNIAYCRAARRGAGEPQSRSLCFGFRVGLVLADK